MLFEYGRSLKHVISLFALGFMRRLLGDIEWKMMGFVVLRAGDDLNHMAELIHMCDCFIAKVFYFGSVKLRLRLREM